MSWGRGLRRRAPLQRAGNGLGTVLRPSRPFLSPGQRAARGGLPPEAGQALMLASTGPVDFFSRAVEASLPEGIAGEGPWGTAAVPHSSCFGGGNVFVCFLWPLGHNRLNFYSSAWRSWALLSCTCPRIAPRWAGSRWSPSVVFPPLAVWAAGRGRSAAAARPQSLIPGTPLGRPGADQVLKVKLPRAKTPPPHRHAT